MSIRCGSVCRRRWGTGWLAGLLNEHLLGALPAEIQRAATLPESDAYESVRQLTMELDRLLNASRFPTGDSRPRTNVDPPMAIDGP